MFLVGTGCLCCVTADHMMTDWPAGFVTSAAVFGCTWLSGLVFVNRSWCRPDCNSLALLRPLSCSGSQRRWSWINSCR